jgi:hypothetical protein
MNTIVNLQHPWETIKHRSLNLPLQDQRIVVHHANKLKFITMSCEESFDQPVINVFHLKKIVSIGVVLKVQVGKLIYIMDNDNLFIVSHVKNDSSLSCLLYMCINLEKLTMVCQVYQYIHFHLLDDAIRCQLCLINDRLMILGPRPDSLQYMYEIDTSSLTICKIKSIRKLDPQDSFFHWTYGDNIYQLRPSNSTLHIYTYHQDLNFSCKIVALDDCIMDRIYELRTITPEWILVKIYSDVHYLKIYFDGAMVKFKYCVDYIVDNDVHCFYPHSQTKYKEVKIIEESSIRIRTVHHQRIHGISNHPNDQTMTIQCHDGEIHVYEQCIISIEYFKVMVSGKFKEQMATLPFDVFTVKNWLKFRYNNCLLDHSNYQDLISVVLLADFVGDIITIQQCYKLLEHPDFGLLAILSHEQLMMIDDIERLVIESVSESARTYMFRNGEINSLIQSMTDDQKVKMINYLTN